MTELKYFPNRFPDYDTSQFQAHLDKNGYIVCDATMNRLKTRVIRLVEEVDEAVSGGQFPPDDFSVYTGLGGTVMLHYMLSKHLDKAGDSEHQLHLADKYVLQCCSDRALRCKRITFLCGVGGPLALNAAIAHKLGQSDRVEESIAKLRSLSDLALNDDSMPDELLYGRSGYLYALLFVRRELRSVDSADDKLFVSEIEAVCSKIISSGKHLAKQHLIKHGPPLMWQWHDKMYLGAAHGIAGIIHTLLLAYDFSASVRNIAEREIRETLDWLLTQRYESGNLMSSVGTSSPDRLVQWCHGACAVPHVYLKYVDLFPKSDRVKQYVEVARESADIVWQRGLLTKGYGICHGAAGNAYAMLAVFKATKDNRYLYRTIKFAEWCMTPEERQTAREADRPFSLFEGSGGTAWFMADFWLNPIQHVSFPAYQLMPNY